MRDWVWAGWCALNIVTLPGRGALDRVGRFPSGTKPGERRVVTVAAAVAVAVVSSSKQPSRKMQSDKQSSVLTQFSILQSPML